MDLNKINVKRQMKWTRYSTVTTYERKIIKLDIKLFINIQKLIRIQQKFTL
jgi:hypothetical protein